MLVIREATEEDREAIALVDAFCFNDPRPRPEELELDSTLCAQVGGQVVGTAGAEALGQWFGGAQVACAGVKGVAVLPEQRGRGVAFALVRELLARRRSAGDVISALYPANSQLYRRLGYEYAGLHPRFSLPVQDLPPAQGQVELIDTSDATLVGPLAECFARYASGHNGPVHSANPRWWSRHVLAHSGEGLHQRTVAVHGPGGLEGYASYFTAENRELRGLVANCKHLVSVSATALRALLGYFRRFENSAGYLAWAGPPSAAPVGLAVSSNGFSIVPSVSRWMARLLDVPGALEARGYAGCLETSFTLSVDDPLFADNAGPWEVRVQGGKAEVGRASADEALKPLPIGLLSSLYTGFASAADLIAVGALSQDDPRLGALAAVFAGPVPWMPDSF